MRGFSGSRASVASGIRHDIGLGCAPKLHFPRGRPTPLNLHVVRRPTSFLRPPGFDAMRWYRNITCSPSPTPLAVGLARLTPGRINLPRKPWVRRTGFSPVLTPTHIGISSPQNLTTLPVWLRRPAMLPYHCHPPRRSGNPKLRYDA